MKNKQKYKKGIKCWLISWEWSNDAAVVADKVIAVLNPHYSEERISFLVEAIYSMCSSTIEEMVAYTQRPNPNPYKSAIENGVITCGHNPWLEARKISDLIIEVDENTGLETIKWNELPKYKRIGDKIEQIRGPLPQQFIRRITGPPSSMAIYDRAKDSFKPGWGLYEIPIRNDL